MRGHFLLGAFACTLVACGSTVDVPVEVDNARDAEAVDEAAIVVDRSDTAPSSSAGDIGVEPPKDVGPPKPPGELTVSVADVAIAEGDTEGAAATFAVTLSRAATDVVTVRYATSDGTATATGSAASGGKDYSPTSGVLAFAAGETRKTVTVPIAGDSIREADETFALTLKSPVNATLGRASATCTLRNDD